MACAALAVVLIGYDGKPNSDIEQLLIGLMIVVAFPSGFLVAGLLGLTYAAIGFCCGVTVKVSYATLLVEWIAFAVVGYLQWFVVLPWVLKKWQPRRTLPSPNE